MGRVQYFAADELTERQAAAFLLAAPGIRTRAVRVPGGSAAAPPWNALVGRAVTEPSDFVRALIGAEDHWPGSMDRRAAAGSATIPALARRRGYRAQTSALEAARRVRAGRAGLGRPGTPVLASLPRSVPARVGPGGRRRRHAADTRDRASGRWRLARGIRIAIAAQRPKVLRDFAWLCEQIFTGGQAVVRGLHQQVLFASRRIDRLTPDNVVDAVIATRAVAKYAALSTALERARITSIPVFAARRAGGSGDRGTTNIARR